MTAAPSTRTDLKSTLEEMRASVAARGTRRGLKGVIEDAFLSLMSMLLAILEDFRAGRLARIAPVAEPPGDGAVADGSPGFRGGFGVESGEARAACWSADFRGMHEAAIPTPNSAAGAEGAAAGNVIRGAEDIGPEAYAEAYPPPSRCAGPSLPLKGGGQAGTILFFRAALRGPVFGMIARLRCRAGWRNARGICRAFPPYDDMADPAERAFFKNAAPGEWISATLSFQRQNYAAITWNRGISS